MAVLCPFLLAAQPLQSASPDMDRWEAELVDHPDNVPVRSLLVRQYFLMSSKDPQAENRRVRHVLWLVRNRPEESVLAEPIVTVTRPPDAVNAVRAAWEAQIARPSVSAATLANAANFFRPVDLSRALDLASKAHALQPKNPEWAGLLGQLYVFRIVGITALNENGFPVGLDLQKFDSRESKDLQAKLLTSNDPAVLGAVAGALLGQGMIAAARVRRQARASELAEAFAKRAQTLEPREPGWHLLLAQVYTQRYETSPDDARAAWARKAMVEFEAGATSPETSRHLLPLRARTAFEAGDSDAAERLAGECLAGAAHMGDSDPAARETALHQCNLISGRVAVRRGDMTAAANFLLASAKVEGAGSLSSFGPNMTLARELLLKGERAVVLEYFRRCAVFWKSGKSALDQWTADVKAGLMPAFGANLEY